MILRLLLELYCAQQFLIVSLFIVLTYLQAAYDYCRMAVKHVGFWIKQY